MSRLLPRALIALVNGTTTESTGSDSSPSTSSSSSSSSPTTIRESSSNAPTAPDNVASSPPSSSSSSSTSSSTSSSLPGCNENLTANTSNTNRFRGLLASRTLLDPPVPKSLFPMPSSSSSSSSDASSSSTSAISITASPSLELPSSSASSSLSSSSSSLSSSSPSSSVSANELLMWSFSTSPSAPSSSSCSTSSPPLSPSSSPFAAAICSLSSSLSSSSSSSTTPAIDFEYSTAAPATVNTRSGCDLSTVDRRALGSLESNASILIPFNEIVLKKEIGSGCFGRVYLALYNYVPVAVKQQTQILHAKLDDFVAEVKILAQLIPHPNVIQLIGISTDAGFDRYYIVLEYCYHGSLLSLLTKRGEQIDAARKLSLLMGIAVGMQHLHDQNIIHRDLAARNVLVNEVDDEFIPKISDFGMSRLLSNSTVGHTMTKLHPIRCSPMEVVLEQTYSRFSDAYSYGCLIVEVYANGVQPFMEVSTNPMEVLNARCHQPTLQPQLPASTPGDVKLMCQQHLFLQNPKQRYDFNAIVDFFDELTSPPKPKKDNHL